ncbi:MAG: TlpA family protein disulfide reductase [Arachnia sp.]
MRRFAVAAVTLLVAGCSTGETPGSVDADVGFQVGDGAVTIVAPEAREAAPVLTGETLSGDDLSTADYAGQIVVLNVWGSWCAPCRAEAPDLVAAAEAMPEVAFLGINTRDLDPAPAKAFVRAFQIDYPSFYDPDGSLLLGFAQLPPTAIPSTLVLDDQGRVGARILGEVSADTLAAVVADVREGT